MRDTEFTDTATDTATQNFWHPMTHPGDSLKNPAKVFVSAEGVEITDNNGHRVIDAVGGLWNANLGYSCEPIKKAIADQLAEMPYYSSFRGTTTQPVVELSAELQNWFKQDGLVRSFFTSGGSDSVETCLRLARQYHKALMERVPPLGRKARLNGNG